MNEFDETEEYENTPEEFGGPSKRAKITKIILRIVGWVIFTAVLAVATTAYLVWQFFVLDLGRVKEIYVEDRN